MLTLQKKDLNLVAHN